LARSKGRVKKQQERGGKEMSIGRVRVKGEIEKKKKGSVHLSSYPNKKKREDKSGGRRKGSDSISVRLRL